MKYKTLKIYIHFLFITFFFMMLSPYVSAKATTYIALGDSITAGTGLASSDDNFVTHLSQELKNQYPDLDTYNYGKNGATIKDVRNVIQSPQVREQLKNADYVTVTIGGNDILRLCAGAAKKLTGKDYKKAKTIPDFAKNNATAQIIKGYLTKPEIQTKLTEFHHKFATNFESMLNELCQAAPHATILLQTIYNPASGSDYTALADCIDFIEQQTNQHIRNLVSTKKTDHVLLFDTYEAFKNQAEKYIRINEDDIHPTELGHELIAKGLFALIDPNAMTNTTESSETTTQVSETNDLDSATQTATTLVTGYNSNTPIGLRILYGIAGCIVLLTLFYGIYRMGHFLFHKIL